MRSQTLCGSKVKWNSEIIHSQGGTCRNATQQVTDDKESTG